MSNSALLMRLGCYAIKYSPVITNNNILRSTRFIPCRTYLEDTEGKTTVKILNKEQDLGLMVDSISTIGFRLNNGMTVLGSMAIFARTVLSWCVSETSEITPESLRLFKLLEPRIDLLVIGLESSDRRNADKVFGSAKSIGLNVEILPTENAVSTFNFLNAEGRNVAGAMIPPLVVRINDDDRLEQKLRYDNIYGEYSERIN